MNVLNLNSMINHCLRKTIVSGDGIGLISKDIIQFIYITIRNSFLFNII